MDNFNVYKDIQARTGGEVYTGVVEPVCTSRSTFIKRFMGLLVLPATEDENLHNLSWGELPQSAAGKATMATESKSIPKEAASTSLADGIEARVRVIDYVGSVVDGAVGHVENGEERLVKTPWFDYNIPFIQTTETGTREIINDRSAIGIVTTTDGTIGEIRRPGYIVAEKQIVDELEKLGKPFVVLLNSTEPYSDETARLTREMSESYGVSVSSVSCEQFKKEDVLRALECVLKEFPVTKVDLYISKWLEILPSIYWLKAQAIQAARNVIQKVTHMKGTSGGLKQQHTDIVRSMSVKNTQVTDGRVGVQVDMDDSYYYQILNDYVGLPVEREYQLTQTLSSLANMQKECEKAQNTLTQMWLKEYGVVTLKRLEIVLDKSQIIKHGNRYGMKMKAEAPSINLIKAHIETEIASIMENGQQARDLITYIKENTRESGDRTWNTNVFGRSIERIVEDSIQAKVPQVTGDYQLKL